MLNKIKITITSALTVLALSSHAAPLSLDELQNIYKVSSDKLKGELISSGRVADMRYNALRGAALAIGAQHGYYERNKQLTESFKNNEKILNGIFDFSMIMRMASQGEDTMFFLPPVIQEAENVLALSADSNTVRVSGKLYDIKRKARLTLRAPNWRQYLIMGTSFEPEEPNTALYPRTRDEKQSWKIWVAEGWSAGYKQAEQEIRKRVRHLGEDFIGMIKYMRLIEEGKIKAPNISKLKQAVSGNESSMTEDERIYQLNLPAEFDLNSGNWNPLYGESRSSLRLPIEATGDE